MIKSMLEAINKQWKLLKGILCTQDDEDFKVILTATTNKAAAVLRELSGDPYVATIHSTLGLKLQKNFSTGEEDLVKTNRFTIMNNTIIVVDEGSMLDNPTTGFLDKALGETSKAVIIGDVFQLAPVSQPKSTMEHMLHKHPTAIMSKVMRHGGPILEAATAFRDVVQTLQFQDIILSDKVIHVDGLTFHDEVKKAFLDPKYDPSKAMILARTNDRVQEYNAHLRQLRGLGTDLQTGELVVTNKPIIANGKIISVDQQVEITYLGNEVDKFGVTGRRVEVDGICTGFLPNRYSEAKDLMKKIARAANKAAKDKEHGKKKKLWAEYFDIKDTWFDLRSQYARTVHKSQGSSYDQVFIDLFDIGWSKLPGDRYVPFRNAPDIARMLYVAISRARNKVILTGDLPIQYRGAMAA